MVASASSSNTQCPSGCSAARSACEAFRMCGSSMASSGRACFAAVTVCSSVASFMPMPCSGMFRVKDYGAIIAAAQLPDRIAPSMVAGRPVSVQSPASSRLRHFVAAPGRFASCAGEAANVARRSRTICHGGRTSGNPVMRAISLQIVFASSSRGASISRSPALMVTEMRPGNAKIQCVVALMTPRIAGRPGGARCGNAR